MFTILNPHISDFFGTPISFILLKRRALKKYAFLIDEAIASGNHINFLINCSSSGLVPDKYFKILPKFARRVFLKIEIFYWLRHNKYHGKVNVFFNEKHVPQKDVLFFLCYRNFLQPKVLTQTANQFLRPIAHLSHYYTYPSGYSNAIKNITNVQIASDVDVGNNTFFRHFFNWYRHTVLILPFAVSKRFFKKMPFANRKQKAVATGTFHLLENDSSKEHLADLKSFSKATTVHPLRRYFFEHKDEISAYIDCFCFPYFESTVKKQSFWKKLIPKKLQVSQSTYFSFDILDKYNEYQYAIIGEEYYNGIPGIGAFEAMACGCVLLGHKDCYQGIGMEDGIHYLAHDNTIENIKELIAFGNANPQKMEEISANAVQFIKDNFTAAVIYSRFINSIQHKTV